MTGRHNSRPATRSGLWAAISLAALVMLQFVAVCRSQEKDEERRDLLLTQMRALAEQTQVKFAKSDRPIEFVASPVFRYADQPRQFVDATLWVWTESGRPAAFQKVEAMDFGESAPPQWQFCFASVSPELLIADWPQGRLFRSTEPGVTFEALPGAPPVAAGNTQRKRQAREIVRKFTARIVTDRAGDTTQEMRLLTTPIFDYVDPKSREFQGAVFGLSTNGTNPDVLLVLEVRYVADKLHWHFAPARMTSGAVTLNYGDSTVWQTKWLNADEGPFPTWTYFVTPRTQPEESGERR